MSTPILNSQMSIVIDSSTLGCTTDFSMDINRETIDKTCMESALAKEYMSGRYDWKVSFSGMLPKSTTIDAGKQSFENLLTKMLTSTSDPSVYVHILPNVSTNSYWKGVGLLRTMNYSGSGESMVTYTGEIQGTGILTKYTTA
jgi:hypothetical protein